MRERLNFFASFPLPLAVQFDVIDQNSVWFLYRLCFSGVYELTAHSNNHSAKSSQKAQKKLVK